MRREQSDNLNERAPWETPRIEKLELQEIETAADLEVAFTSSYSTGDL